MYIRNKQGNNIAMFLLLFVQYTHLCTFTANTALHGQYERVPISTTFARKKITFLLYIAGRNNLFPFIAPNIEQLKNLGTNDNVTLLVYLNTWHNGALMTQRFIVYKHKLVQVGNDSQEDSGDPATLIKAGTWAFTNFPADTTMLCLWNHGSGPVDPHSYNRMPNTAGMYKYNTETNLIELDRTITFLRYIELYGTDRGICYDDATKRYINHHEVGKALRTISDISLQGKPIDIFCCDACLMASIELAYALKPYKENPVAHFMISSQEVVLAAGYEYQKMLSPALSKLVATKDLARHIVQSFAESYRHITQDYTQSAIDLTKIDTVYEAIDIVAQLLLEGIATQEQNSVYRFIKKSGSKETCTHFQEPTYKDLHHLFSNMIHNLTMITLKNPESTQLFRSRLSQALTFACHTITDAVLANVVGKNISRAHGISIYLPLDERVHSSYTQTDFARSSSWLNFIKTYTQHRTIDEATNLATPL